MFFKIRLFNWFLSAYKCRFFSSSLSYHNMKLSWFQISDFDHESSNLSSYINGYDWESSFNFFGFLTGYKGSKALQNFIWGYLLHTKTFNLFLKSTTVIENKIFPTIMYRFFPENTYLVWFWDEFMWIVENNYWCLALVFLFVYKNAFIWETKRSEHPCCSC